MIIDIDKEVIVHLIAAVCSIHKLYEKNADEIIKNHDEIFNVYDFLYELCLDSNGMIDDYYFDRIIFSNISLNDKFSLLFENYNA